jgi:hypothetical protein
MKFMNSCLLWCVGEFTLLQMYNIPYFVSRRYEHSYESDCARLASTDENELPLYSNARNAVIQVKGEKQVLIHYLNFANTGLAHIRCSSDTQFDNMLQQLEEKSSTHVYSYCAIEISKLRRHRGHGNR